MVKIPFVNIEVAEPRVTELLPDFIDLIVRLCARLLGAAHEVVYPISHEQHNLRILEDYQTLPREFDCVLKKLEDGRIKSKEQLSSDVEEAAYDYYRRLLRTGAHGASEEEHEDTMLRKLGWEQRPATPAVLEAYYQENPSAFATPDDIADFLGLSTSSLPPISSDTQGEQEISEEARAAATAAALAAAGYTDAESLSAARQTLKKTLSGQNALVTRERLTAQAQQMARLQTRLRSRKAQSVQTATSAGLGLVLGVFAFKGVGLAVKHLMRAMRKGKKGVTAGGRPLVPVRRAAVNQLPQQPSPAQARGGQQQQQQQSANQGVGRQSSAQGSTQGGLRQRGAAQGIPSQQQQQQQRPAQGSGLGLGKGRQTQEEGGEDKKDAAAQSKNQSSHQQQQQEQQKQQQAEAAGRRSRPATRMR